jgi:hypothetical protein
MRWIAPFLFSAMMALPAMAQQSEIVFSRGAWLVEIVKFDDGTLACSARVTQGEDTFAIWSFQDGYTQLQLYSPEWTFPDSKADLVLQIDRRPQWDVSDAELNENSVLISLSDDKDAVDLLIEIARGNRVYVRNAQGNPVINFTLAGSRASMQTLGECETAIGEVSGNPFK